MEIDITEETSKRLVFDLPGAGHTLCNAVKSELWKNKHIKIATYRIKHPLKGIPTMILETDGEIKPGKALKDAISHLRVQTEKFESQVKSSAK